MKNNVEKIRIKIILWICIIGVEFDSYGSAPLLSAYGEILVAEPSVTIQLQFPYNINSDYANAATGTTTTGSGTVTYSSPFAVLSTTAAANSTALLNSKARLHYQPGQGCACLFTTKFTTGAANSTQLIGLGNLSSNTTLTFANLQDGFFFGYSGTSFGIFQYNNAVATFTAQTSWNGDKFNGTGASGVTLDPTKGNVYKIQYQWLGFGMINFFIENPSTGALTLVHSIQYANANTSTSLKNPTLQLTAAVSNTTNTSNIVLSIASFSGMIQGFVDMNHSSRYSAFSGTAVTAITNNSPTFNSILTIQNKPTYQTLTNQVEVFPDFLSLMMTTNTDVIFTLFLNPTFGAALAYSDVSTNTSVVQFSSTQTTITAGTGIALATFYLATAASTALIDLSDYEFKLEPNDVLCLAASRINGAGSVMAALSWRERF